MLRLPSIAVSALLLPVLFGSMAVAPAVLDAQGPPRVEIRPSSATGGTAVAARNVLSEKPFDELLRSGFPTNLHFRAEVWVAGRWFDDVVDRAEWDVRVRYDVIGRTYEVARRAGGELVSLGTYSRFADARAASELAYPVPLKLPSGRKGYVAVSVDVETLEISDLAEMQRWLQGEARPAVQGKRNPGTALTRGLRTLTTRLLGGEIRHLEARSPMQQF